jgi:peptidyl-prolyl cis-trans isomerase D
MATLEKIRNKAGLLVGVVGLALFAFVIGDFLKSGSTYFNQSKQKVATVDGESVSIQDFQKRVEEVTNNYRQNGALQDEQLAQIRESVFEDMVGRLLLDGEAKKVGFDVGHEETRDIIMGDNISPQIQQIPAFQNPQTKQFDKTRLLNFLQGLEATDISEIPANQVEQFLNTKKQWLEMEEAVVRQKKLSKFGTLLSSAISANSLDARAAFDENGVNVDFTYAFQAFSTVPDSTVKVSDAEIRSLYDERREGFKQSKAQIVDYIAAPIVPSQADIAEAGSRMEAAKEELAATANIAETVSENSDAPFVDAFVSFNNLTEDQRVFVKTAKIGDIEGPTLKQTTYTIHKLVATTTAPDSVKVNLLNLPPYDEARLKVFADSLLGVVRGGKAFADLSKELTGGQGDGDIGWQTEAALTQGLDAKFATALFDAKVGETFITTSSYGTHLVQVVEKTKPVEKYKVATITAEVSPSQDTYNKIYNDLNQYVSKNNTLDLFKSAASEAGYFCQTGIQFSENQPSVQPAANSRQVIKWAFDHSKGDISDIFECDDYFIVAAVEGSLKEGYRPLADVQETLKREILNRKKGETIIANLKQTNPASIEAYAEAMRGRVDTVKFVTFATPRITGIGADPAVNAVATQTPEGALSAPFAGRNGVYVLQVVGRNTSEQPYDEQSQRMQQSMQYRYRLMSLLQNNALLKEHARIEDNRIRFY